MVPDCNLGLLHNALPSKNILVFGCVSDSGSLVVLGVLNRRQARWAQFLIRFDFKITYRSGKQQGKADTLSRHSYLAPHPGDLTFDNQKQIIMGSTRLQATLVFDTPLDFGLIDTIREYLKTNVFAQAILDQIDSSWASCSQSQLGTDY